jgi:hypothetical protein
MSIRKVTSIGVLVVAGCLLYAGRALLPPDSTEPDASNHWSAFRCEVGRQQSFGFALREAHSIFLGNRADNKSVLGRIDLEGKLRVTHHAQRGEVCLVGVTTPAVSVRQFKLVNQPLADESGDSTLLENREVLVEVDREGRFNRMAFAETDPLAWQVLGRLLLDNLQFTVKPSLAWSEKNSSSRGQSTVAYTREGSAKNHVLKRRLSYAGMENADLRHSASALLNAEGFLEEIRSDEQITHLTSAGKIEIDSRFGLWFEGQTLVNPGALNASLSWVAPGPLASANDGAARELEAEAAGLSLEDIQRGLASWSHASEVDHGWLRASVAALDFHPEWIRRLGEDLDRRVNRRELALGLDLLASVGSHAAQEVMVKVLRRLDKESDDYVILVQRLGMVGRPSVSTAEFLARAHEQAKSRDARFATAMAVGASAHAIRSSHPQESKQIARALLVDANRAQDPATRAAYLRSLGNAGDAELAGDLLVHGNDPDAGVRRATARALRRTPTSETRAALLALTSDPDATVSTAAVETLAEQGTDASVLASLASTIGLGEVQVGAYPAVLDLIGSSLRAFPAASKQVLEVVLQDTRSMPDVAIRARALLRQTS